MWVNEGTPTMSFVLYNINLKCMCDASYVTWKYRQHRRYHVISARKYKIRKNVNKLGGRFNSSGTPLFIRVFEFWLQHYAYAYSATTISEYVFDNSEPCIPLAAVKA